MANKVLGVARRGGRKKKYNEKAVTGIATEAGYLRALEAGVRERVGNHNDVNSLINEGVRLVIKKYHLVDPQADTAKEAQATHK